MSPDLPPALLRALPAAPVRTQPVVGGDIACAWRVELADGQVLFAKTLTGAPVGFFAAEAHGLQWLANAGAISVPKVIAASGPDQRDGFLVLPFLVAGPRTEPGTQERLGRALAALHSVDAPCWGATADNFIGRLPQPNGGGTCPSWPLFYRDFRLLPQLQAAEQQTRLAPRNRRALLQVMDRLPSLLATDAPPTRVHGDLWSGNVVVDEAGEPWLIDPAAYGGHREVDLAMMALFGGFAERVFGAYTEVAPLEPGWERRRTVLQLYPVLVHLNLFGTRYNGHLERLLERLR